MFSIGTIPLKLGPLMEFPKRNVLYYLLNFVQTLRFYSLNMIRNCLVRFYIGQFFEDKIAVLIDTDGFGVKVCLVYILKGIDFGSLRFGSNTF